MFCGPEAMKFLRASHFGFACLEQRLLVKQGFAWLQSAMKLYSRETTIYMLVVCLENWGFIYETYVYILRYANACYDCHMIYQQYWRMYMYKAFDSATIVCTFLYIFKKLNAIHLRFWAIGVRKIYTLSKTCKIPDCAKRLRSVL